MSLKRIGVNDSKAQNWIEWLRPGRTVGKTNRTGSVDIFWIFIQLSNAFYSNRPCQNEYQTMQLTHESHYTTHWLPSAAPRAPLRTGITIHIIEHVARLYSKIGVFLNYLIGLVVRLKGAADVSHPWWHKDGIYVMPNWCRIYEKQHKYQPKMDEPFRLWAQRRNWKIRRNRNGKETESMRWAKRKMLYNRIRQR